MAEGRGHAAGAGRALTSAVDGFLPGLKRTASAHFARDLGLVTAVAAVLVSAVVLLQEGRGAAAL